MQGSKGNDQDVQQMDEGVFTRVPHFPKEYKQKLEGGIIDKKPRNRGCGCGMEGMDNCGPDTRPEPTLGALNDPIHIPTNRRRTFGARLSMSLNNSVRAWLAERAVRPSYGGRPPDAERAPPRPEPDGRAQAQTESQANPTR